MSTQTRTLPSQQEWDMMIGCSGHQQKTISQDDMKTMAAVLQAREHAPRQNVYPEVPVSIVEYVTDPRAAQIQVLFKAMDERGKKTLLVMAVSMAKLQKDL